ncbi:WecB/TagA/CpsF family glycosyltransferase [Hyphococcus sp.]|uniref:WecB/TagA/CpsF family glycosyltransferase n=1 Tax=Hyphococcus sp. TaxID=2038636 RepID=UPI003D126B75
MSDPLLNQTAGLPEPAGAVAPLRRDDFDRDVWCLMGLAVDAVDITRAVAAIDDAVRTRRQLSFVTPNVNFLVRAMKDEGARRDILNADLSLADGAPLVAMAKMLGVPVPSRVAGSDLFEALRRRPAFAGRRLKVFFFGGRPGAAEAAFEAINREKGGVEAVGWHNPGFGDVESMSSDEVIAKINATEADFVMVALGAAKGQAWIERNKDRLTAPVTAHLGAVVDFTAGGVARAPEWMRRSGLEWLWRIKEEPSLWRRYFDDGAALAGLALRGLLPQAGRTRAAPGAAEAETVLTPSETLIRLSGQLGSGALKPVREAFRAAAARGRPVRLDLSGVETADCAFLGQVLMLEKHLARSSATISLAGANRRLESLFRANRMNYARAAAGERANDEAPGMRQAAL